MHPEQNRKTAAVAVVAVLCKAVAVAVDVVDVDADMEAAMQQKTVEDTRLVRTEMRNMAVFVLELVTGTGTGTVIVAVIAYMIYAELLEHLHCEPWTQTQKVENFPHLSPSCSID